MVKPCHKALCSFISFLILHITLFSQTNEPDFAKLIAQYNEVKDFASNADGPIPTRFVTPPVMHFDYCYPCDKVRQAEYSKGSEDFVNKYLNPEVQYIKKADEVIGGLNQQVAFTNLTQEKIDQMKNEMIEATIKLSDRNHRKLAHAWDEFKDDAKRNFLIADLLVRHLKIRQTFGREPLEGMPTVYEIVKQLVNSGINVIAQAKESLDYPVLLNIKWIAALYNNAESIGIPMDELQTSLFEFANVNRFRIYVETASRSAGPGGTYQNAQLTGEGVFLATPDSNCKLQWRLIGPDTLRLIYKLEAFEMKANPGGNLPYTGTEFFYSPPPEIKLGFCEQNRDTADFYGFGHHHKEEETWKVKDKTVQMESLGILYTMGFNDPQQYGRKAYRTDTANRYAKVQFGFLLKDKLVNMQKIVFDKRIDGKTHSMLPTAWFRVKIEHDE